MAREGRLAGLAEGEGYRVNDAYLRVGLDRAGGRSGLNVWLSAYGVAPHTVDAFRARYQELVARLAAGPPGRDA